MIISMHGPAGSGKSTIAKKIADKLSWPHYYMGGIRRDRAKERGMTLAEYNKLGESDPSTDKEVDVYQEKLGKNQDNFIIEGRTSFHFIPHSLKIYIDTDKKIGALRIFNHLKNDNKRNEDKNLNSVEDVLKSNEKRMNSDIKRYKQYYDIDVFNKKHFDFIIDSSNLSREEVFEKVWKFIEKQLQST